MLETTETQKVSKLKLHAGALHELEDLNPIECSFEYYS